MLKKALIIGHGYVGQKLKELLTSLDWTVHTLSRSKHPSDQNHISADVSQSFELSDEYTTVFYLVSPDSYDAEAYNRAYTLGVENTIKAITQPQKAKRFIFVSSSSIVKTDTEKWVDEHTPIQQNHFSERALLQGETLALESPMPTVVTRFSGIYGPGRTRLIDSVRKGTATLKQKPYISNRIHVEDCASALVHLAQLKNPQKLYFASDDQPTPFNDITIWLAEYLKLERPRLEDAPSVSLRMGFKKISNQRLRKSGFMFKYPTYREGLAACL